MYSTDCKQSQAKNLTLDSIDCKAQTNKQKANPKLGIGTECLGWFVGPCIVQIVRPKTKQEQNLTLEQNVLVGLWVRV